MSLTCVSRSTIDSIHIIQPINFDEDILPEVGAIGKYQYVRYLLLNLIAIPVCVNWLADLVLSAEIPHCCNIPNMHTTYREYFENNTHHLLFPSPAGSTSSLAVSRDYESCHMWETECYRQNRTDFSGCGVVSCQMGYHFLTNGTAADRVTMINQFELVCEKKYLKRVSSLVFMAGVLMGAMLIGYLSDKYGRRATMFSVIGLQVLFGFILAFMYSYVSFMCMRFLVGTTTAGLYLVIFVLGCELVGPKYRTFVGLGYEITFGFGYLVLAALGYFIQNWKTFQISISLSSVLLFLYWKAIPESPRWLIITGNLKKASEIIQKMAKENGVVLGQELKNKFQSDSELMQQEKAKMGGKGGEGKGKKGEEGQGGGGFGGLGNKDDTMRGSRLSSVTGDTAVTSALMSSSTSVLDLLRYPKLRTRVLISSAIWLVLSMVYYSMSFMVDQFRGNLYLNICLSGLVEIPATVIAFPMINKLGRKIPLIIFFLLSSISLMACVFIPSNMHFAVTASAMFGKFFITGGFAIAYVYSAELYPTPLRNNGIGINSMFGRVGALLSPVALLLGELWWLNALFATLSVLCLLASIGVMFLPETKNSPLPETINKIEGNVDLIMPKSKKNVSFGSISNNIQGMYSEIPSVKEEPNYQNGTAEASSKFQQQKTPGYRRLQVAKAPEGSLYNISSSDNNSENRDSGVPVSSLLTQQTSQIYQTNRIYKLETTV